MMPILHMAFKKYKFNTILYTIFAAKMGCIPLKVHEITNGNIKSLCIKVLFHTKQNML